MTPLRPKQTPARRLSALLDGLDARLVGHDAEVTGVTHDSRAVQAGDLYAALPGERTHGARFLADAVAAGAVAVLTDEDGAAVAADLPAAVHAAPRSILGRVAARVYDDPSAAIAVAGITGTNGKTTTAYLVDAGLRAAGHLTGLVGTVETRVADEVVPSVRTTPEAPDLQALFAVMRERGVTAASMEVSSHALALGRVDGTSYAVGIFTNLSQDHLDFHADLDDYFAAKARLFEPHRCAAAVVNVDDGYGRRLAGQLAGVLPLTTYGTDGDWSATDLDEGRDGTSFTLRTPDATLPASTRLPGAFNVSNAVGAIAALTVLGVPLQTAVDGVAALPGVPGRMERVEAGQPFLAVVDYAHTPDAVATLLAALRPAATGRLIGVLGCGGDRDRAKRPLMGRALAEGADLAILTSDNPRSEDPLQILRSMQAGAESVAGAEVVVEPDRAAAIARAVAAAGAGDVVVVAGKGHEQGQEAGGVVVPFDDRQVLRAALTAVAS